MELSAEKRERGEAREKQAELRPRPDVRLCAISRSRNLSQGSTVLVKWLPHSVTIGHPAAPRLPEKRFDEKLGTFCGLIFENTCTSLFPWTETRAAPPGGGPSVALRGGPAA